MIALLIAFRLNVPIVQVPEKSIKYIYIGLYSEVNIYINFSILFDLLSVVRWSTTFGVYAVKSASKRTSANRCRAQAILEPEKYGATVTASAPRYQCVAARNVIKSKMEQEKRNEIIFVLFEYIENSIESVSLRLLSGRTRRMNHKTKSNEWWGEGKPVRIRSDANKNGECVE